MKAATRLIVVCSAFALAACESGEGRTTVVGQLASERIELTAETTEPIIEIVMDEGAVVQRGDLLVQLDVERAAARLAEAEASMSQAEGRARRTRARTAQRTNCRRARKRGWRRERAFVPQDRIRPL